MSLLDVAKDVFLEIACRISLEDVSCLRKTCKLLKEKIDEIGFRPCVARVVTRKYSQKVWSLCTANHSANEFVVVPSPPNPLLTKRFEEQLSDDYFSIVPKHPGQKGKNSKKKKSKKSCKVWTKLKKSFCISDMMYYINGNLFVLNFCGIDLLKSTRRHWNL